MRIGPLKRASLERTSNRSVHDQVSEAVEITPLSRTDHISRLRYFAELFAELCALHAPIAPITPSYSVENIAAPTFSLRRLTEGL